MTSTTHQAAAGAQLPQFTVKTSDLGGNTNGRQLLVVYRVNEKPARGMTLPAA